MRPAQNGKNGNQTVCCEKEVEKELKKELMIGGRRRAETKEEESRSTTAKAGKWQKKMVQVRKKKEQPTIEHFSFFSLSHFFYFSVSQKVD